MISTQLTQFQEFERNPAFGKVQCKSQTVSARPIRVSPYTHVRCGELWDSCRTLDAPKVATGIGGCVFISNFLPAVVVVHGVSNASVNDM